MTGIATDLQRNDLQATDLQKKDLQANSAQPTSFDNYLEPVLRRREPRVIAYGEKLLDFRNWVTNEVDAQANYTDRYAPAALETYDRDGGIANRVVLNPWYETQHQEAYRRGIIALPYTERRAPPGEFHYGIPALAGRHQPALSRHPHWCSCLFTG